MSGLREVSGRVDDRVLTWPLDVRRGMDRLRVAWLMHRWKCGEPSCPRKTFTVSLP